MNLDGDPDETSAALGRLLRVNKHGSVWDDESQQNYLRTVELAQQIEREGCPGCELVVDVLPAVGPHWVVEEVHDPDCPLYGSEALGQC